LKLTFKGIYETFLCIYIFLVLFYDIFGAQ